MEYIFSENQIFSNSLFHFEYMHLMYQYYISCRSVAPSWKNLNDDLEATVPPILKKKKSSIYDAQKFVLVLDWLTWTNSKPIL